MKIVTQHKLLLDLKSPNLDCNLELLRLLESNDFLTSNGYLQYEESDKNDLIKILNDYNIPIKL